MKNEPARLRDRRIDEGYIVTENPKKQTVWKEAGVTSATNSPFCKLKSIPVRAGQCKQGIEHIKREIKQLEVNLAEREQLSIMSPYLTEGINQVCKGGSNWLHWRRGRDSNPRDSYLPNGFRDRPLQPLGHLSAIQNM